MVMNSYVVSGPGVQLSAVFRVLCTAGGANFDVSSHLMARAQAEKVKARFPSSVLLGMGSAVQARLAGQRRGSATWSPCSRKLDLPREHTWPPMALTGSESRAISEELGSLPME